MHLGTWRGTHADIDTAVAHVYSYLRSSECESRKQLLFVSPSSSALFCVVESDKLYSSSYLARGRLRYQQLTSVFGAIVTAITAAVVVEEEMIVLELRTFGKNGI